MNGNDSKAMRRLPCTCRAAEQVLWFDEVDSTNTVARRLLAETWPSADTAGPDVAGAETAAACAGAAGVFGDGVADAAGAVSDGIADAAGAVSDGIADAADAPHIAVVVADSQTAGHGRLGRQWVSRPGESSMVSFTTVLPQSLATDPHVNGWLQMIAGLAAIDAMIAVLAETGADRCCASHGPKDDCALMLKWPNDVFLHGRKLGGILLELVTPLGGAATAGSGAIPRADVQSRPSGPDGGRMVGLVIGVGINLAIPADRLPTELATSLQLHRAPLPDPERMRDLIAAGMAASLRSRLREFIADPVGYAAALRDEMTSKCWTIGRRVEARLVDGGTVRGTAMRLNVDASLMVRDAGGYEHTITTGDVGVL